MKMAAESDLRGERQQQLEDAIRESLGLIKEYEDKLRLSDDPKEKRRCERNIAEQRELLANYRAELQNLELAANMASGDVLTGLKAALRVQAPFVLESLTLEDLIERMEKMATTIYRKVIDPWSQGDNTGVGEGLGLRLARKRHSAIEGSQGMLIQLARFYRNASRLDKDELWLTSQYIGDLRSNFEALLYLVRMMPESSATLTIKLRLENYLRSIIDTAGGLEAELRGAADTERNLGLRSAWQGKIASVIESLLHQTDLTLTETYNLLDCVGRS